MNIGERKTIEKWLLRGGSTSTHEPDSDNADVGIDSKSVNALFCAFEKGSSIYFGGPFFMIC